MCYDVFTRCASYFEVFYYSYMNSFYGKMEVDFMAQWQPSTFTPDKTADTAAYAASLSSSATSQSLNRTFLSSLFEQIFNFPSEALSLYNAINGTNYSDPGLLTITTLSGCFRCCDGCHIWNLCLNGGFTKITVIMHTFFACR